jgi:hypothetical protein
VQESDVDFTHHLAATIIPASNAVGIQQLEVLTHLIRLYSRGAAYILLRCWRLAVNAAPSTYAFGGSYFGAPAWNLMPRCLKFV